MFLMPPLVEFYNMRRFFVILQDFGFFLFLILSVVFSLGIFSTNFLNMQPGLTSFSPRVSIPPFCVHNWIFSIQLFSFHIYHRHYCLKLQPGLIVLSHCGLSCRNLILIFDF